MLEDLEETAEGYDELGMQIGWEKDEFVDSIV